MARDTGTLGLVILLGASPAIACSAPPSSGSLQPEKQISGGGGIVSYASGGAATNGGSPSLDPASGGTTSTVDASGEPAHDPALFNWPESTADGGTGTHCKAGHYVGTYNCNIEWGDAGAFSYPLSGPVDLRLEEAQSGEFLSVSGGTLTSAVGIVSLDSQLIGTLNCQTGEFTGTLQNGTFAIQPFPPGGTFDGHLNANFASAGPKLDGTWTLRGGGQFSASSCSGPWNATWQGS
jgi:hypothetical protein